MNEVSELRATVATAVGALEGWAVSRWAPELFGRDTDHVLHHSFAVAIPETTPHEATNRQRMGPETVLLVTSIVEVMWAHRLRGDAQSADYSAALDAEQDVLNAVLHINGQAVRFERASRRAALEGWVLGTLRFQVAHRLGLI